MSNGSLQAEFVLPQQAVAYHLEVFRTHSLDACMFFLQIRNHISQIPLPLMVLATLAYKHVHHQAKAHDYLPPFYPFYVLNHQASHTNNGGTPLRPRLA
jgi:hypothetical protein